MGVSLFHHLHFFAVSICRYGYYEQKEGGEIPHPRIVSNYQLLVVPTAAVVRPRREHGRGLVEGVSRVLPPSL